MSIVDISDLNPHCDSGRCNLQGLVNELETLEQTTDYANDAQYEDASGPAKSPCSHPFFCTQ